MADVSARSFDPPTVFTFALLLTAAATGSCQAETLVTYTRDSTIYTASVADGKHVRKICGGDDLCISGDGKFLVYTRTLSVPRKPKLAKDDGIALLLRELAGGKKTLLPSDSQPLILREAVSSFVHHFAALQDR